MTNLQPQTKQDSDEPIDIRILKLRLKIMEVEASMGATQASAQVEIARLQYLTVEIQENSKVKIKQLEAQSELDLQKALREAAEIQERYRLERTKVMCDLCFSLGSTLIDVAVPAIAANFSPMRTIRQVE
jgi:uncharacterized protein YaiL (DUF2058 family)